MKYSKVYIESFGYELAPVVVTSPNWKPAWSRCISSLHFAPGQLQALTGIRERRWWEPGIRFSGSHRRRQEGAGRGRHLDPSDIGALIYTGVCREQFEPATACRVAARPRRRRQRRGLRPLQRLPGRPERHPRSRQPDRARPDPGRTGGLLRERPGNQRHHDRADAGGPAAWRHFASSLATLTGGSGAVRCCSPTAPSPSGRRRLRGGMTQAAPEHHGLCLWGMTPDGKGGFAQSMSTDAVNVMKYGVELGRRTWEAFLPEVGWRAGEVDRVVCHQVGSAHQSDHPEDPRHPAGKGFHHLRVPRQHGNRFASAHRRAGRQSGTSCRPATGSACSASAAGSTASCSASSGKP